jgi:hypothetical protein
MLRLLNNLWRARVRKDQWPEQPLKRARRHPLFPAVPMTHLKGSTGTAMQLHRFSRADKARHDRVAARTVRKRLRKLRKLHTRTPLSDFAERASALQRELASLRPNVRLKHNR